MRRPSPQQAPDRTSRGDHVDVEQIMRDIRGRIAQRQGIDLSNQQIQDLAARRLESILDPRAIKPSLLEGLKRGAAAPTGPADKIPNEPTFSFEDTTLYDSHRGALRFARRLLNPFLKLLFNPNPLIRALHLQAKLNVEANERNAERDRRQTEWNALHYEIIQRLVTDVARASLELQALSMKVEALGARVDFNDRRVGVLEGSAHRARPQGRAPEPIVANPIAVSPVASSPAIEASPTPAEMTPPSGDIQPPTPDAAKRRRRRRRGRRGGSGPGDYVPGTSATSPASAPTAGVTVPDAAAPTDGPREPSGDTVAYQHQDVSEAPPISAPPPGADRPED